MRIYSQIVSSYSNYNSQDINMWQSQVENEHYSTVSGLIRCLECFIEITCVPLNSMHSKFQSYSYWQSLIIAV